MSSSCVVRHMSGQPFNKPSLEGLLLGSGQPMRVKGSQANLYVKTQVSVGIWPYRSKATSQCQSHK